MALLNCADVLQPTSPSTETAGASAQLLGANVARSGLRVTVDPAATNPVYLLLGTGTASATNWTIALAPGGFWDGQISQVAWRGPVQFFSAGAGKVGVAEA